MLDDLTPIIITALYLLGMMISLGIFIYIDYHKIMNLLSDQIVAEISALFWPIVLPVVIFILLFRFISKKIKVFTLPYKRKKAVVESRKTTAMKKKRRNMLKEYVAMLGEQEKEEEEDVWY